VPAVSEAETRSASNWRAPVAVPAAAKTVTRMPSGLSDLVGELSTQSETFRTRWAAHNVRYHDRGDKRLHHPIVGDLSLTFETMQLSADAGLTMFVYTAEAGSKSEEALNLLASWTATLDPAATTPSVRPA
jgi:hypothetical protein